MNYRQFLETKVFPIRNTKTQKPKIKLYMGIKADTEKEADKKLEELKEAMVEVVTK